MTTSPTVSYPWAITTLRASFSTTSWPGRSFSSSTAGLTLTRIFRPPVNTSAVPSSHASRKTPNPEGGWASRSTSSLSATIWSRASRSVSASRSFWPVTEARLASVSRRRSSRRPDMPGRVGQPPPQHCHLLLEEGDLRGEALNLVIVPRCARSFIPSGHAPTPFREQTSLRPYLSEALA